MDHRVANTFLIAAALAAVGCGEQREPLPAAPEYHTVTSLLSGCDFNHIKTLANKVFTNSAQKQRVNSLITQMKQAGAYTTTAKARGFDIMAEIAVAVHNNRVGTATRGSDLTNHLILCMFNPGSEAAAYPASFPEDFTVAVTPLLHGAYEVPGTSTGNSDAVCSRPLPVSPPCSGFSGMAPLGTGEWSQYARVLVYGRPGSTSQSYNWKVVPANAQFTPTVVVGVCVTDPTALLHEENVGLLLFVDAGFLSATCSPTAMLDDWSLHGLASGLARWGTGLFSPRALWGATIVNPGGLGGSTGGIKSEFGPQQVVVTLTFQTQPLDATVSAPIPTAPAGGIVVHETSSGEAVPGTRVSLEAVDNNGVPADLTCPALPGGVCSALADANGDAAFGSPQIDKTGAYRLVASATVDGRPGIPVNQATSNKFNIRP